MNLFAELRRRSVFRVAAAYGVVSWKGRNDEAPTLIRFPLKTW